MNVKPACACLSVWLLRNEGDKVSFFSEWDLTERKTQTSSSTQTKRILRIIRMAKLKCFYLKIFPKNKLPCTVPKTGLKPLLLNFIIILHWHRVITFFKILLTIIWWVLNNEVFLISHSLVVKCLFLVSLCYTTWTDKI